MTIPRSPYGVAGPFPTPGYDRHITTVPLPRGYIDGLILSNDASDATNDIGVAVGVCRSTSNAGSTERAKQRDIEISTALIKQLDVPWAPGNGGFRSSSSIGNGTWHVFGIGGAGKKDDLFAHDAVDPSAVLPSGFTAYRRIGSLVRASGALRAFTQGPDGFFRIKTPLLDVDDTALTTSSGNYTLATIPTGLSLRVLVNLLVGSGAATKEIYVRNPSDTDTAPSTTAAPLETTRTLSGASTSGQAIFVTNTSAQIAARSDGSATTIRVAPLGWWDSRGANS